MLLFFKGSFVYLKHVVKVKQKKKGKQNEVKY